MNRVNRYGSRISTKLSWQRSGRAGFFSVTRS
ncbi:Transport of hexuronates [Escherichia coli P12b]|nr:Transport of hexuronates [Escherichia coli P12b]